MLYALKATKQDKSHLKNIQMDDKSEYIDSLNNYVDEQSNVDGKSPKERVRKGVATGGRGQIAEPVAQEENLDKKEKEKNRGMSIHDLTRYYSINPGVDLSINITADILDVLFGWNLGASAKKHLIHPAKDFLMYGYENPWSSKEKAVKVVKYAATGIYRFLSRAAVREARQRTQEAWQRTQEARRNAAEKLKDDTPKIPLLDPNATVSPEQTQHLDDDAISIPSRRKYSEFSFLNNPSVSGDNDDSESPARRVNRFLSF